MLNQSAIFINSYLNKLDLFFILWEASHNFLDIIIKLYIELFWFVLLSFKKKIQNENFSMGDSVMF